MAVVVTVVVLEVSHSIHPCLWGMVRVCNFADSFDTLKERHQMKITVTEQIFLDEFRNSSRADQFSREALVAIFAYITEAEGDVPADEGSEIELDVVGICCEYVEVENSDTDEIENYSNCDVIAKLEDSTVFYQS
jgi:hypothetical protein